MHGLQGPSPPLTAMPASAPHRITQVEPARRQKASAAAVKAIPMVQGSTIAERPSCQLTAIIRAREATFTPSRKNPATGERRILGTIGPLQATKMNAGKKIPAVATAAQTGPSSTPPT